MSNNKIIEHEGNSANAGLTQEETMSFTVAA